MSGEGEATGTGGKGVIVGLDEGVRCLRRETKSEGIRWTEVELRERRVEEEI